MYIEPGSPWENGYAESFHSRLRDEFLATEEFENLRAAQRLTARWKDEYNNYYNANGSPAEQPEDGGLTPEQCSLLDDSEEDEYEKLYKGDSHEEEEEDYYQHLDAKNYEKITKNMEILSAYPMNKELRVMFSNAT